MTRHLYKICLTLVFLCYTAEVKSTGLPFNTDSLFALNEKGEFELATQYLEKSLKALSTSEAKTTAKQLLNNASFAYAENQLDRSLQETELAKRISLQFQFQDLEFAAAIKQIEIYRKIRKYENALVLIHQYLSGIDGTKLPLQTSFFNRASAVHNEMFASGMGEQNIDTAIQYSKKSIALAKSIYRTDLMAYSYLELGNIYQKLGKIDTAKGQFLKALKYWDKSDSVNYANALQNYGQIQLKEKNYDSCLFYMDKALLYLKESPQYALISNSYGGKKDAYFQKGDSLKYHRNKYKQAYFNHLLDQQIYRSKILDLNTKYATKEKEAAFNKQKASLIKTESRHQTTLIILGCAALTTITLAYFYFITKRKNKKLATLAEENSFLVGESNHRIKNNLQLIISLIGRELYKEKDDRESLKEVSDQITSIATLHQHLHVNDSKEKVNIDAYLANILENFKSLNYFENIEVNVRLEKIELKVDQAVYLGLLLTELVTNSVKHAFQNKSNTAKLISINLLKKKSNIELCYQDNGVGLAKTQEPKLVSLLCKQLKAKFELNTGDAEGFKLHLIQKA